MRAGGLAGAVGALIAVGLTACGGPGPAAAPLVRVPHPAWVVYGPPAPGPPQFVDSMAAGGFGRLAVLMGYESPPGSGRVWWLNWQTGTWRPGPVMGQGALARYAGRLWFWGLVGGRLGLWQAAPRREEVFAPTAGGVPGGLAVARRGLWVGWSDGRGRSWVARWTSHGLQPAYTVPGQLTQVTVSGGRVWWATLRPSMLWERLPNGRITATRLPAAPIALQARGAEAALLLTTAGNVPGTGTLLAVVRGRAVRLYGLAAPRGPGQGVGQEGGAVSLAWGAYGLFAVVAQVDPVDAWVARLSPVGGAPEWLTVHVSPMVPNRFVPWFPIVATPRWLLVGLGNRLLIVPGPPATRPAIP